MYYRQTTPAFHILSVLSCIVCTVHFQSMMDVFHQWTFQRKNAASTAAGCLRSWPQKTWEDCPICLAPGDAMQIVHMWKLEVLCFTELILTSFLQAVVAASTQGEDRKEAPSDDLTPGSINSLVLKNTHLISSKIISNTTTFNMNITVSGTKLCLFGLYFKAAKVPSCGISVNLNPFKQLGKIQKKRNNVY